MANGNQSTAIAPELRTGLNSTGSTILKGTAVKGDATNYDGITPVTAVNDVVMGVAFEDIPAGKRGNVAVRGRVPVIASAALTLHGRVGVTTAGKSTNTVAVGSAVLGIACEVGATDTLAEVELLGPGAFN